MLIKLVQGNNSHIIHNGQIDLSGAVATENDAASALLQHQPTPQLQDAQQKVVLHCLSTLFSLFIIYFNFKS